MRWLLLAVLCASCEGNPPHSYYDYSYLDYAGEQGGVARVGMDVPLGSTFSPWDTQEAIVARQQLGATLALVEQVRGLAAQGAPGPAAPADEPAPDAPDAPRDEGGGLMPTHAMYHEDPMGYYAKLAGVLSWESLCKLMLITFFGLEMRRKARV